MKKGIATLLTLTLTAGAVTGCGGGTTATSETQETKATETPSTQETTQDVTKEKLNIITTIFPVYDWTKEILGDDIENVNLEMLIDSGVDLHSFQPTIDDIVAIENCDVFIYVGGHSDTWAEEVIAASNNKDMKIINLVEVLGDAVKMEEHVDGMQSSSHDHDHDEEHDHDHDEEHDHDHDEEAHTHSHEDEHIWLSLKNAAVICEAIAKELTALGGEGNYIENATNYVAELMSLNEEYESVVASSPTNTLLFADRFPFRYLVDDYGIDYYAAFSGCSAETEASFETITFLSQKLDELGLEEIIIIDGSNTKIADTVASNTQDKNQETIVLNSMQSTTSKDVADGASYIEIMRQNLDALGIALD